MRALMKKSAPTAARAAPDPPGLEVDRVQALAADHLILEIAADRAGRRQLRHVRRHAVGRDRIGALEVDRDRQLDRRDDPLGIGQRQFQRQPLGIVIAVRRRDRRAAGRDRLGARLGDRLGAARVPGIVEDDRVARHVERGEGAIFAGHGRP